MFLLIETRDILKFCNLHTLLGHTLQRRLRCGVMIWNNNGLCGTVVVPDSVKRDFVGLL